MNDALNRNLDYRVLRAAKVARRLAHGVEGQVGDMTDSDWDWGLVTELEEMAEKLVEIQARFYEAATYNENEDHARAEVLAEAEMELLAKDTAAVNQTLALCEKRDRVSMAALRKVAYAMSISHTEFTDEYPEALQKNLNDVTLIDSGLLAGWINLIWKKEDR